MWNWSSVIYELPCKTLAKRSNSWAALKMMTTKNFNFRVIKMCAALWRKNVQISIFNENFASSMTIEKCCVRISNLISNLISISTWLQCSTEKVLFVDDDWKMFNFKCVQLNRMFLPISWPYLDLNRQTSPTFKCRYGWSVVELGFTLEWSWTLTSYR